jgi:hypothetical protein
MPFIPIENTVQMNIRATLSGIPVENVFHLQKDDGSPFSLPDMVLLAGTARAAWANTMLPLVVPAYLCTAVYCRDLTTENGLVFEDAFAPTDAGTASGEPMPGNVAIVITHRTGLAGRSYRGRSYICGLSELSVNANNVVSGFAASLIVAFIAFKNEVIDEGFVFGVASRFADNAPRTEGIFTRIVSSSLRDTRVDTQRRRLS